MIMKVTYIEQIERRTAFSRKMYCPSCGGHEYDIVRISKVDEIPMGYIDDNVTWIVRCPQCGCEGLPAPSRAIAIARWKRE